MLLIAEPFLWPLTYVSFTEFIQLCRDGDNNNRLNSPVSVINQDNHNRHGHKSSKQFFSWDRSFNYLYNTYLFCTKHKRIGNTELNIHNISVYIFYKAKLIVWHNYYILNCQSIFHVHAFLFSCWFCLDIRSHVFQDTLSSRCTLEKFWTFMTLPLPFRFWDCGYS